MGLTAKEKRAATEVTAPRYQKAKKNQKGIILEESTALTGYNRCYAAYLLRIQGKKRYIDRNTVIVADSGKKRVKPRMRFYDELVITVLVQIWLIMDCLCGKRLAPMLPEVVPLLKKHKEITLDKTTKNAFLNIFFAPMLPWFVAYSIIFSMPYASYP